MQRAPLVSEQAVVGHLVREHVLEAVGGFSTEAGLLNESGHLQALQRRGGIDSLANDIDQQLVRELTPDHRGDAQNFDGIAVEAIESRANHRLHRIRQAQRRHAAGRDTFTIAHGDQALLHERLAGFFEEERIAASSLMHAVRELCRDTRHAQHATHDLDRAREVQRRELDARRVPVAVLPGQLRAAGDHDQQRVRARDFHELAQRFARTLVTPMPVFQQQQGGRYVSHRR